jgi:hypothetical protein
MSPMQRMSDAFSDAISEDGTDLALLLKLLRGMAAVTASTLEAEMYMESLKQLTGANRE